MVKVHTLREILLSIRYPLRKIQAKWQLLCARFPSFLGGGRVRLSLMPFGKQLPSLWDVDPKPRWRRPRCSMLRDPDRCIDLPALDRIAFSSSLVAEVRAILTWAQQTLLPSHEILGSRRELFEEVGLSNPHRPSGEDWSSFCECAQVAISWSWDRKGLAPRYRQVRRSMASPQDICRAISICPDTRVPWERM
jgi:hypothetical protein